MSEQEYPESSLVEHLIELRARLVRAIVGLLAVLLLLLPFSRTIYTWLAEPQLPNGQTMIATNPAGAFFAPLKLTFFVAVFVAVPWLLYQLWAFVAPGLYAREKRLAVPLLASSVLLFYLGCAFAYFLVLPAVFHFLTTFRPEVIAITPDANAYLDFVLAIFFAFGTSFELPVAMVILVLLGWVSPQQFKESRGYAVVGIFIVAAVLTPPDVVSQLLLAIPMCVLYELGIHAAKWLVPSSVVKPAGGLVWARRATVVDRCCSRINGCGSTAADQRSALRTRCLTQRKTPASAGVFRCRDQAANTLLGAGTGGGGVRPRCANICFQAAYTAPTYSGMITVLIDN